MTPPKPEALTHPHGPTVHDAQTAAQDLAESMTIAVQSFEAAYPGVIVHSIPIRRAESGPPTPPTVSVKIQITTE